MERNHHESIAREFTASSVHVRDVKRILSFRARFHTQSPALSRLEVEIASQSSRSHLRLPWIINLRHEGRNANELGDERRRRKRRAEVVGSLY